MNSSKWALGIAVVAVVIAIGGYFYPVAVHLAGEIGTRFNNGLYVGPVSASTFTVTAAGVTTIAGLTTNNGGAISAYPNATTTMTGTETLVPADLINYDTVILSPNVAGNTTLTLFASSTATTWLPTSGNHQKVCLVNATTTAGAFYTLAGGTGTKLLTASSSATATGAATIYPQKMGCFDFVRAPATATTFDLLGAFTSFN